MSTKNADSKALVSVSGIVISCCKCFCAFNNNYKISAKCCDNLVVKGDSQQKNPALLNLQRQVSAVPDYCAGYA